MNETDANAFVSVLLSTTIETRTEVTDRKSITNAPIEILLIPS